MRGPRRALPDHRLQRMIKKRAGWLAALFLGEMLTATAMGVFEKEIDKRRGAGAVRAAHHLLRRQLRLAGHHAVIRAMALGEVRLRDWWRVVRRELAGRARARVASSAPSASSASSSGRACSSTYGQHFMLVGAHGGALSLIGVVTFGTLAGSMLPFVLRRLGFDPASALGALRGHAGGRDRADHLLQHCLRNHARNPAVTSESISPYPSYSEKRERAPRRIAEDFAGRAFTDLARSSGAHSEHRSRTSGAFRHRTREDGEVGARSS